VDRNDKAVKISKETANRTLKRAIHYLHPLPQLAVAGATLRAALGVERSATGAAVIHRAREPAGEERARQKYAEENSYI
jgi:hypothetical protein